VGGTGLYLRVLTRGLAPVPEIPAAVREASGTLMRRLGARGLHAELAARDPEAAALHPGDTQRVRRAWEVLEATGRPLGDWQRQPAGPTGWRHLAFVLLPPRRRLYEACDARGLAMMRAGALDEARRLHTLGVDPDLPAMKAVGLRELFAHLEGRTTLEAAIAAVQQATRRYAKRQVTWFGHQMPEAHRVEGAAWDNEGLEGLWPAFFTRIRSLLLTR
jgi:tRNA dimethylallyltransferase